jgi:hypothetical protein
MPRLRIKHPADQQRAASAEVLELRSLLSAGAAAVHQATHAADHAAASTPDTKPALTPIPVTVQLNGNGLFNQIPGGSLTITPVVLKAGAHVTIHVSAVDNSGPTAVTYTAVIKGKITSWQDVGISTQVSLVPTGTLIAKTGDGHTLGKASAQKTTPLSLTLHQSTLAYITLDVHFLSHSKPPILADFQAEAT